MRQDFQRAALVLQQHAGEKRELGQDAVTLANSQFPNIKDQFADIAQT